MVRKTLDSYVDTGHGAERTQITALPTTDRESQGRGFHGYCHMTNDFTRQRLWTVVGLCSSVREPGGVRQSRADFSLLRAGQGLQYGGSWGLQDPEQTPRVWVYPEDQPTALQPCRLSSQPGLPLSMACAAWNATWRHRVAKTSVRGQVEAALPFQSLLQRWSKLREWHKV